MGKILKFLEGLDLLKRNIFLKSENGIFYA